MKLQLDCIPCFQKQALKASKLVSNDAVFQERVLRRVMENLIWMKWTKKPPQIAQVVHRIVREECGHADPYEKIKFSSNEQVLKRYDEFYQRVMEADDQLFKALELSIAGNIIDYGPDIRIELDETLDQVSKQGLSINDYIGLKASLKDARNLFYIGDNAGEIVFDLLLIEQILREFPVESVLYGIKGAPILNDATMKDAEQVGLDRLENIEFIKIDVGVPGSGISRDSPEFLKIIKESDVVISKGQGNYESLSEIGGIFFLLMAKCPIVARDLDVEIGSFILKEVSS